MVGIIYLLTFPNNKVYVGQTTKTLEKRFRQHIKAAYDFSGSNPFTPIKNAIREYGVLNIKKEIIDTAETLEELDEKEIYWIKFYNSSVKFKNSNGYNYQEGGHQNTYAARFKSAKEIIKTILKEHSKGKTNREISEKVGKSAHYVNAVLKGRHWSAYTKIKNVPYSISKVHGAAKTSPEEIDRILELSEEFSAYWISEITGIPQGRISSILNGENWSNYTNIKKGEKGKHILNEEEVQYIVNQDRDGVYYRDIAKEMGISYVTVWDILNGRSHSDITNIKRKKKTDNRRYTNDEIKAIVFWNSQGCSCKEIGEKLGIDLRIIWSVINGLSHTDITGLKPSDRKHNDRLTHEELDVILEMNKNGVDSYEIAKELNREVFIIQRVLYGGAYSDYTGIKYKAPREKKKQEDYKIIDQILELNKKGIS